MLKRLLLFTLALTACARAARSVATPTALPSPQVFVVTVTARPPASSPGAPVNTPTLPVVVSPAPRPAEPAKLTLTASDGAQLVGLFYPPLNAPAPGVLLLHQLGGSKADWDAFARDLQQQNVAVFALDLRGYGESAKPEDWSKAPTDVRTAWDFFLARPEVDPQAVGIVGASIGGNLALIVGANNPAVVTVIALSPGQDYHGLTPAPLLANFGARPVLLIASNEDTYAYTSAQQMTKLLSAGESYYLTNAGHGTAMFSDPNLETVLFDWLKNKLGILKG